MKISIVCLASRSGGGLAILKDLFDYAKEVDEENCWQFLLSDQEIGESTTRIEIVRTTPHYKGWKSRIWAELTTARRALRDFDPDVVLSLQNIDTPARGRRPLAIYMHQALPFQTDYKLSPIKAGERELAWRQYILRWLILFSIRRSVITFVQTKWLANSLNQLGQHGKTVVIGHTIASDQLNPASPAVEPKQFFYPAAGTSYKNHRTLHLALRILNGKGIELTGKIAVTLTKEQLIEITGLDPSRELQWYRPLGWIEPEQVLQEYSRSILVFPSLVESLGLPLYEARSLGIPIVAGDTGFGREALEKYANVSWFNTTDPTSLAEAMVHSLTNPSLGFVAQTQELQKEEPWKLMLNELDRVCRSRKNE